MFDKLAQKLQTVVLVLIVGVLVMAMFTFGGPQLEGCASGGGSYAAKVNGQVITVGDFEATYRLPGFDRQPIEQQRTRKLKEHILSGLVERTLLAEKARELGYRVEEREVMRRFLEDGTVYLSMGHDAPAMLPRGGISLTRGEGLEKDRAKAIIQNGLRRSVAEFTEAQVKEALAERMRETVRASVTVSPREAWDEFVRENENARIEYVRFRPRYYGRELDPTDADVEAWMESNQKLVDERYKADKHKYTDLPEQVHARHILLKIPSEASEQKKAEIRQKAESLRSRVKAGESFEELAKKHSEDTGSAPKGGDLGWNERGRMVKPFDEAQFSLEPGEVSDLVETQFGFHIIEVLGKREGDVPPEQAKREIAEKLYGEHRAKQLAEEAASETLAEMKEGLDGEALEQWLRERRGEAPPAAGGTAGGDGSQGDGGEGETDEGTPEPESDPLAPTVEQSEEFGRNDTPITGLAAAPLVNAVFEEGVEMPEQPLELGGDLVVFRVLERSEARREDFEGKERARIMRRLLRGKREEAVRSYVQKLRDEAEAEGAVRINESVLSYGDEGSTDEAS